MHWLLHSQEPLEHTHSIRHIAHNTADIYSAAATNWEAGSHQERCKINFNLPLLFLLHLTACIPLLYSLLPSLIPQKVEKNVSEGELLLLLIGLTLAGIGSAVQLEQTKENTKILFGWGYY